MAKYIKKKKYNFLEHTADVKFLAYGKNLEEAFANSALALKETISGDLFIESKKEKTIKVSGEDMESLLYSFLEEFLYLLDAEDFLLSGIEDLHINEKEMTLDADVTGDDASKYEFTNDVKAITYNEMKVGTKEIDDKRQYFCQVVLDV